MLSALLGLQTDTIVDYKITKHFNERKSVLEHLKVLKPHDIDIIRTPPPHKINWGYLSKNPFIFEFNYTFLTLSPPETHCGYTQSLGSLNIQNSLVGKGLKERMKNTIAEEIMMNRFHPLNANKWIGWGFDDFE
jgi:hypothetical protein